VDVDDTLLAEESFREMLAALDFRATFEPARNELRMRATLAPELLPVNGDGRVVPFCQCPRQDSNRMERAHPRLGRARVESIEVRVT
jgi:hypothetical protein